MALIDCWGVEAGAIAFNLGPDVLLGTPGAVAPPAGFGHGSYCLRINPAAATAMAVEWTRFTSSRLYMGFALQIDSFGSSSDQDIVQVKALGTAGASKFLHFGVDGGTKKLHFTNAAGTKLVDPTVHAVTDILWVDLMFDFSGATWAYRWAVNGTELAAITGDAQVASAVVFATAGLPAGLAGPYSAYMDDFVFGNAAGDFGQFANSPRVVPLVMRAGAGSIDTASSVAIAQFHDEAAAAVTDASGGSISHLPPGSTGRYIAWDGGTPGATDKVVGYVADTSESVPATLVRAYISMRNADGTASVNTFGISAISGATSTSIFSGSVASATSKYRTAILTAPAGGWTQSAVNALKLQFGAGTSNNNAGHPAVEAAIVEALYVGSSASATLANRVGTVARDTTGTATSLSVIVPAGVLDGELLVGLFATADATTGLTMPAPSGWRQRGFLVDPTGGGQTLGIFTKTALATDAGTSVAFALGGTTTSGQRQMVGVIVSVYDSALGSAIAFDALSDPVSDATGPALAAPASPIAPTAPAAVLSVVAQDQSGGTSSANFTEATDSGGSVAELVDDGETGTSLLLAAAIEVQTTTPVSATHTFTYGGAGTSALGATLASLTVIVASGNVTPPGAPTGLAASSVTDVQVTLGWTSNVDGRAASYNVYRNGVVIATTTTTSYQDATVAASTTYSYTVSAVDSSGNESPQTSALPVTTSAPSAPKQVGGLLGDPWRTVGGGADVTPPTTPPGVAASPLSSSSISVSWSAATDNVGVVGYRIRRGSTGALLATVAAGTLSWAETGLSAATTYTYTVEAFDAAGNTSAPSSAVSAQTQAAAGSQSWASVTAYVQTPPPFTPLNTYVVSNFTDFNSRLQNAQPGDLIDASNASFTYTSEYVVSKSGTAANHIRVILGPNCIFSYNGGTNTPAIWFKQCAYLDWFDGKYTTNANGGQGILINGCHDMLLWIREWNGGKVYNCGRDGAMVASYTSGGVDFPLPYTYKGSSVQAGNYKLDLYFGEITQCGLGYQIAGYDPHAVKGTGLHGIQYGDHKYPNYDCRLAASVHDQPTGAAIQLGGAVTVDGIYGHTIMLKAVNITDVVNDGGGNGSALQLWGFNVIDNLIAYLEATSCAGYAVNTTGMTGNTTYNNLSTDTVQYGRARSCCLHLAAGTSPWRPGPNGGPVYQDIATS